jgi:peptidoglycan/xylan/chitin deacetylase (PgdA/CDA1 family)
MKLIVKTAFNLMLLLSLRGALLADDVSYRVQKVPYSRYLDTGTLTVVASFDGSKLLDRWEDILDFAKAHGVKFTFFASGVYFIPNSDRDKYIYPLDTSRKGRSDIGFGGASTDVVKRIEYVNRALKEGHDIESHLNGHFDGTHWTEENWRVEFGEFNDLMKFLPEKVHHVRFPLLAMNHRVFPVLAECDIRSITSVVENDFENFNRITTEYKGKPFSFLEFPIAYEMDNRAKIILMDYNFYLYDEQHHIDPDKSEEDMVKLYLDEARRCMKDTRPFFISHHFSNWNHTAYWHAMQKVILEIEKKYKLNYMTVAELYIRLSGQGLP